MKIRVTIDAQSFEVEVGDLTARPIPVTVEGDTFLVWPEEAGGATAAASQPAVSAPAPALPPSRPASAASTSPTNGNGKASGAGTKMVTAPIPGVIISVTVKDGDSVQFGQELCVLEAMKMKNAIRANRAGKVAAIRVAAGDLVKHGQVLLEYTD